MKHTPTPWVYSPHRTAHDSIIHTVDAVPNEQGYIDEGGVIGSSEWIWLEPADAAFIVRCVNSHDDLLEALELAVEYIRKVEGTIPRDSTGANVCTPDLRKCDSAIAKARGE